MDHDWTGFGSQIGIARYIAPLPFISFFLLSPVSCVPFGGLGGGSCPSTYVWIGVINLQSGPPCEVESLFGDFILQARIPEFSRIALADCTFCAI